MVSVYSKEVPINQVFGSVGLSRANLPDMILKECLLLPMLGDRRSGIVVDGSYHPAGNLVRGTCELEFRDFSETPQAEVEEEYSGDPVYFGGYMFRHYGHFLLETMSRLTRQDWLEEAEEVLFLADRVTESRLAEESFLRQYMDILGIRSRVRVLSKPCSVRRLMVSRPRFIIRHSIDERFYEFGRSVGNKIKAGCGTNERICLSRRRFSSQGRHIYNLDIVEDILQDMGFQFIYTEEMSVKDQINAIESASIVAGFSGSAFHNLLFCSPNKKVIYFSSEPRINANIIMIDRVRKDDSYYVILGKADSSADITREITRIL